MAQRSTALCGLTDLRGVLQRRLLVEVGGGGVERGRAGRQPVLNQHLSRGGGAEWEMLHIEPSRTLQPSCACHS